MGHREGGPCRRQGRAAGPYAESLGSHDKANKVTGKSAFTTATVYPLILCTQEKWCRLEAHSSLASCPGDVSTSTTTPLPPGPFVPLSEEARVWSMCPAYGSPRFDSQYQRGWSKPTRTVIIKQKAGEIAYQWVGCLTCRWSTGSNPWQPI